MIKESGASLNYSTYPQKANHVITQPLKTLICTFSIIFFDATKVNSRLAYEKVIFEIVEFRKLTIKLLLFFDHHERNGYKNE